MKYLIIILLASVLGCILVLSKTDDTNINQLQFYFYNSQPITEAVIVAAHVKAQKESQRYYGGQVYEKQLVPADKLLKEIANSEIPITKINAKKLQNQWQRNNIEVMDISKISKYDREDIERSLYYSEDYFYHADSKFRGLLAAVQKAYLQRNRLMIADLFRCRGTSCTPYDFYGIHQIGKHLRKQNLSKIGFVLTGYNGKPTQNIKKMWVNDQLVFEKTLENPRLPEKLNLTYDGTKEYHVKIALQESYISPVFYQERTFDFQTTSCN